MLHFVLKLERAVHCKHSLIPLLPFVICNMWNGQYLRICHQTAKVRNMHKDSCGLCFLTLLSLYPSVPVKIINQNMVNILVKSRKYGSGS